MKIKRHLSVFLMHSIKVPTPFKREFMPKAKQEGMQLEFCCWLGPTFCSVSRKRFRSSVSR